jgi:hypothetical protein
MLGLPPAEHLRHAGENMRRAVRIFNDARGYARDGDCPESVKRLAWAAHALGEAGAHISGMDRGLAQGTFLKRYRRFARDLRNYLGRSRCIRRA